MNPEYQQALEKPVEYIDSINHELSIFIKQIYEHSCHTTDSSLLMGIISMTYTLQHRLEVLRHSVLHLSDASNDKKEKEQEKEERKTQLVKELSKLFEINE